MTAAGHRGDLVVGIDPVRDGRLALAWATDEAHRRRLALRLVVVVPPLRETELVDENPRHQAQARAGREALRTAADWARARNADVRVSCELLDGAPAAVVSGLAQEAGMVVLGSRHLSRTEEFLSGGSLAVPVTAQARCPVAVVGDAEHSTQVPPYLVVGVDGSASSRSALAFAFEEADLRRCELRAIAVWQPPVFSRWTGATPLDAERRLLAETTAGWSEKYPGLRASHEVLVGSPVEVLAAAAEHALAVVVGRRGGGGYTGMRLGSVVHGLLHRAHCPVITVPGP
ncbi:universal stress protein [Streptomyces sp. NPDC058195]|uniref:universal stress protein n=1 Tax=Streptomyces sp. NPDC058195 TaxID=3346375 RepID=UPI0036E58003